MDAEQLFLRTLQDLERRASEQDEYEVLLAAALLRKLFLDAHPLVDQVNARYRLRLRFLINGRTAYEDMVLELGPVYWSLEDGFEPRPDLPPGLRSPQEATRDQMLARRVMFVHGHDVSVRDLIAQLSHIEGAVHSGAPQEQREELLAQVSRSIYLGGLPAGIRQVQSIARVVLAGLAPLRDAVEAAQTRGRDSPADD